MPTFRIRATFTLSGYQYIKAETEKEALELASGMGALDFSIDDEDIETVEVEDGE